MISRREVLKDLEHVEKLVFLYKEWNISGPYCLAENCAVRYLKRSEMWNVLISGASTHSAIFSRSPFRIRTIPAQNIMSYHRKINNRQTCTCPAPYLNSGYQFRMPYDTLGEPYRTLQPVPPLPNLRPPCLRLRLTGNIPGGAHSSQSLPFSFSSSDESEILK